MVEKIDKITTIRVRQSTKNELRNVELCSDETDENILKRILERYKETEE